jgi:hypothetical protein
MSVGGFLESHEMLTNRPARRWRLLLDPVLLGALVLLALSACGGGKDDAGDFARLLRGLSLPYPVAEAETAILARFGDRPGARAVLLAADRGYTVQQIVAAGVEARLSGQGAVAGASGGEEAPLGKSSGRFSLASATDSLYASLKAPQRHPAPATLDLLDEVLDVLGGGVGPEYVVEASGDKIDVRPKPTEAGRTLTGTVLGLLFAGYDLDTIVEAIFFQPTSIDFQGAVYLFDENGLICPQLSDFCEEQLKDLFDGEWRRAFGLPDREEPARPSEGPVCASAALDEDALRKSKPTLLEVIDNKVTICRAGDEFQADAALNVRWSSAITGGGRCEHTTGNTFSGSGSVPSGDARRWETRGKYEVTQEVFGPFEAVPRASCSKLADSANPDHSFVIVIDGTKMSGIFEGLEWKIDDARELVGK